MATVTITQQPYIGTKNLISVHNPNKIKWSYVPNDAGAVITSTVTISSVVFNGVELSNNGTTWLYELDLTEIIKYFHNAFSHYASATTIGARKSSLVKSLLLTIDGLEDGGSTDEVTTTVYLSHGINQIGNLYGSTMQKLYDRLLHDKFFYFPGYPCELYWSTIADTVNNQDIIVDGIFITNAYINSLKGLFDIKIDSFRHLIQNKGNYLVSIIDDMTPSIITSWTNVDITTLTSSGKDITSMVDAAVGDHYCKSNTFAVVAGEEYIIDMEINLNSGNIPVAYLDVAGVGTQLVLMNKLGRNKLKITAENTGTATLQFYVYNGLPVNCEITINKFYKFVQDGTFTINTKQVPCKNPITFVTWYNETYEAFSSSSMTIWSAIESTGSGYALTSIDESKVYNDNILIIFEYRLYVFSGQSPMFVLRDNLGDASTGGQLSEDSNVCYLKSTRESHKYLYIHSSAAASFQLTNLAIYVIDPNTQGKYIRYLTTQGYYKFWLFNKYFKIQGNQTKIGSLINNFDSMATADSRVKNIGFKDVFQKLILTSEQVSKEDQKELMSLFTSPAVYIWTGTIGDTDDETLWTLVEVEGSHEINEKNNFQDFTITAVLPELYTQKL